jgi:glycosyltransferase involved in cell wall biosynthesis
MELVIAHYHYRPGGVRRVIELAAPHLVRALRSSIRRVVLAGGEAPDARWQAFLRRALGAVPLEWFIEPAFSYFSEQRAAPAAITRQCRLALNRLFAGGGDRDWLVWAHNLGLARNLLFARELMRVCEARRIPLVAHHHDWWFDNRWQRWAELKRAGFPTIETVAQTVFSTAPNVRHAAINRADAAVLRRHFKRCAAWLPDPAGPAALPATGRIQHARRWLRAELGDDAPVWLLPARVLRRKNVAEALLLTRWLRPGAWLVTTAGISSEDERPYGERLADAARRRGWRLHLGLLQGGEAGKPTVAELIGACEAVMSTSIREGFGLPPLEAAAARRPLIARRLPNIAPDLAQFGFRFPHSYRDVFISPVLFDWQSEIARQERLLRRWLGQLPRAWRHLAGEPAMLTGRRRPRPVPFSRLTLTAQLEVLTRPPEESWTLCAPLNPFLPRWRDMAARCALRVAPWPREAARWLSGRAYAQRLARLFEAAPGATPDRLAGRNAQRELMVERLSAPDLYPLLWSANT